MVSDMNVDELRDQIRRKYGKDVEDFRTRVLSPEGRTGPDTRIEAGKSLMPSTSFHSLTDRHALIFDFAERDRGPAEAHVLRGS